MNHVTTRQIEREMIDWLAKFQTRIKESQIYNVGSGKYGIVEENIITPASSNEPTIIRRTLLYTGIESAIEAQDQSYFMTRTRKHTADNDSVIEIEKGIPQDMIPDDRNIAIDARRQPKVETRFVVVTIEDAVANEEMPRLDLYPESATEKAE